MSKREYTKAELGLIYGLLAGSSIFLLMLALSWAKIGRAQMHGGQP